MAGFSVPELRRKLNLLVETGHFPDRTAIAGAFGLSEVTLRGWANGSSGTPHDTVPRKNAAALIDLYARALPDLPKDQIQELISGPADDLEVLLKAGSANSLKELIAIEADKSNAAIFYDNPNSMGLVRRAGSAQPAPQFTVKLGQAFRLEFKTTSRAGFLIALQSAPSGWAVVSSSLDRKQNRIHIFGVEADGSLPFMVEDNEVGRHVFVVAQAARAFPAELHLSEQDGVPLDRVLLAHFIRHFEGQDKSSRRLMAAEIEITK